MVKVTISKTDYKYFDKARRAANISDYHKTHIGCIAVYQGDIIGIGCNCNKTHPIQKKYNRYRDLHEDNGVEALPKLHAEISCLNAIRNLDINFTKVKVYIYRIRKDQLFGISRPCPSCMAAIKDLGITDVFYTTNDGDVHEQLQNSTVGGK